MTFFLMLYPSLDTSGLIWGNSFNLFMLQSLNLKAGKNKWTYHIQSSLRINPCLVHNGASLVAQLVKNRLQRRRPGFDPWVGEIPWRRERLPTPVFWPGEFHWLYSQWVGEIPWRRERLPTPVFWPGEFHWLYSQWGRRVRHYWATFTFTYND